MGIGHSKNLLYMKWRIFDENLFYPISDGSILNCLESLSQGSTPTNAGNIKKLLSLATYEESTSDLLPKDLSPFVSWPLAITFFKTDKNLCP